MRFAVLDFETTGNQPGDSVIQVGLVLIENNQITETYSSYIYTEDTIPAFISELTGIKQEDVANAPRVEEVMNHLLPMLDQSVLVAHQVSFDLGFLQRLLEECGYGYFNGRAVDTIDLLKLTFPGLVSMQLSIAASELGIVNERPHQADSDALAAAEVFLKCLEQLENLPLLTLQRIEQQLLQGTAAVSDLAWLVGQIREQKEQLPERADHNEYYRQFALKNGEWSSDDEQVEEFTNEMEAESFAAFLEQLKQNLFQHFEHFEPRPAQEEMMEHVYAALAEDKHLMIEAGTGTGKSLGYLIPALYYSFIHDETVVVSTHTINLQEQLLKRDIPLLNQVFPAPFKAALLKGRSHYLCLRKFEQRVNLLEPGQNKDEVLTIAQMLVWLGQTEHGDDEELHLGAKGKDVWNEVASDTDSCLNRACPWFHRCYYHRAKHKANQANVVITNHSMLFTDMIAEHRLLPAYQNLIVDEAHHFEEVASHHLGRSITYFSFVFTLTRLYRDAKNGLLVNLLQRLGNNQDEKSLSWRNYIQETMPKLVQVKEEWEQLTDLIYDALTKEAAVSGGQESAQYVYRFKDNQAPHSWDMIHEMESNIHSLLTDVLKKLEQVLNELKENKDELELQSTVTDLGGAVKSLMLVRDDLRFFTARPNQGYVYWLESNTTSAKKSLQMHAVPLNVSPMIRESFFEQKESIVLTSATMSVNRSFAYAADRFGIQSYLETELLNTVQLQSPFNYRKQALVCIPRDFPKIRGAGADPLFLEPLVQSLAEVAETTSGRMLVLFTSYQMLRSVYEALKPKLALAGIDVIGQGIDSGNRSKLIHWFREGKASILLGTSSFWEGVDIPGDSLSCLAMIRLPFQPPNHPLIEARSEHLKKENRNPFMDYAVPQAVIRFKQGFGRLIRQASDRGVVVIYDTRVLETYYGKHFLYSLPGPKIEHMRTQVLAERIKQWFEDEPREVVQ